MRALEIDRLDDSFISFEVYTIPDLVMAIYLLSLTSGIMALCAMHACHTEVDDNLGRVFAALERSGQLHNTVIILSTDHGEQLGDHHLINKLGFFDQSCE